MVAVGQASVCFVLAITVRIAGDRSQHSRPLRCGQIIVMKIVVIMAAAVAESVVVRESGAVASVASLEADAEVVLVGTLGQVVAAESLADVERGSRTLAVTPAVVELAKVVLVVAAVSADSLAVSAKSSAAAIAVAAAEVATKVVFISRSCRPSVMPPRLRTAAAVRSATMVVVDAVHQSDVAQDASQVASYVSSSLASVAGRLV